MNTAKLKAYAPQARKDFIKAVTERANYYGVFSDDHIEPIEFKGDVAIVGERAFTKKEGELREKLVNRIKRDRFELVMRACAYTWFNRFVALRYMELHDYLEHGYRVLSNNSGSDIPELLDHAADVHFQGLDKDKVVELRLAGNKDNELYRLLIVAQCNALHKAMPFLFERIDSETELLLPDNLLHSNSPIRKMVNEIDEEDWNDVEIIGWIYQFYISERKDEVIGKVVKSEDIPAATQLFTPNWIVKYMVQNTLGRKWLATYPDSPLKDKMEYYIESAEQDPEVQEQLDSITPKELNPEEITFLDPACGSGHILVEAYDIFKEIYLERGYRTKDIPRLILEKNLFGLDIDDRAAQLACFAVLMRARRDDRRILDRNDLPLNVMTICESRGLDKEKIAEIASKRHGEKDSWKFVHELIDLFENGKTFGSLISISDRLVDKLDDMKCGIESYKTGDDALFEYLEKSILDSVKPFINQAQVLTKKYDCVVTNPPYMGSKLFCPELKLFINQHYKDEKSDLYSCFILQNIKLCHNMGFIAMITIPNWMFLSSFENFRKRLLEKSFIVNFIHIGRGVWGSDFGSCSFVICNYPIGAYRGSYKRLFNKQGSVANIDKLEKRFFENEVHSASAIDIKKIPGSPIAYWVSDSVRDTFAMGALIGSIAPVKQGLATSNNERFLRLWHEVNFKKINLKCETIEDTKGYAHKWYPHNKGGAFRKWYGNQEYVVNWQNNGEELWEYTATLNQGSNVRLKSRDYYFKEGASWTEVTIGVTSARYIPSGFIFDTTGPTIFDDKKYGVLFYLGLLNSKITRLFVSLLNPTLHFTLRDANSFPIPNNIQTTSVLSNIQNLVDIAKLDWNSYEISWAFKLPPFLNSDYHQSSLKATYNKLCYHWNNITTEMQQLEDENNRIFIEAYGLQDELSIDSPISEITLTCNPYYRYGGDKTEEELEALLQTDTIKELISYAIGSMMGRYSLDQPRLIYAHSGNIDFDPFKYTTFPADDDGIIPILDQDWFPDDAIKRFVDFLKVAWSPETLNENLKFVADSLKPKRNETPIDTIRRYLSSSFFKDHIKTYKKRPIYWLFSSGKQKAFECLVYLHRYNETTLSRMRNSYVTPLQGNISARLEFLQNEKDAAASASAQRKIQKEIDILRKKQTELSAFDDELRHYADMKISLDLDDGVKVNYGKFGNLLAEKKAITGKK